MGIRIKPRITFKIRILSFFMAFVMVFVGLPYIGVELTVNAAERAIRFTVTDTNSHFKDQMNDNKTATGSLYTYTGKYTQNNRTTLFDYVSDYELSNGYNNCKQDESGYMDVYTAFNNAISQSKTSATPLYATDNITINYTPDTTIFNDTDMIYVYLWNNAQSTGHQTPWPGIQMTYDYENSRYTCTLHPSLYGFDDTYKPDRIIFNNGKSGDSQRKTGDITQEMSVNNTYTFDNRVIVKFIVSHDKQYISQANPRQTVKVYLREEDSNGNELHNNGWPGALMTYIDNDTYTYEVPSLNFTPNAMRFIIGSNDAWRTQKVYIGSMVQGKTYQATYSSSNTTTNTSYYHCTSASGSQPIYDTIYSTPLYFGDFWLSNDANGYTSSNHPAYNNFLWQANMGLKPYGTKGSAAVQNLVYEKLSGNDNKNSAGDLLDTADGNVTGGVVGGTVLPYFSKSWAEAKPSLMKYYDKDTDGNKIVFPFYETYTSLDNATLKETAGDGNELARFYQFNSKESNLKFNIGAADHTGYFSETNVDIYKRWEDSSHNFHSSVKDDRSNVGFFPFNESQEEKGTINNHNLAFGTKLEMDFQLESDGCVGAVTLDGEKLKSVDSETRIHTTFEFEGDDDLWVFIDGNLVLDMGGDHLKAYGKIDFADGTATVNQAINFKAPGSQTRDPGDDLSADPVKNKQKTNIYNLLSGNNTANSYDTNVAHTMTVFYMERGMLDSNLFIRFNYSPISNASKMKIAEVTKFDNVNDGLLTLTKKVAEDDVFQYTVSNKGTLKDDVLDNEAKYPITVPRTRTAESDSNLTTALTPNGTGTAKVYNYYSPRTQVGTTWTNNTNTENRVSGTSYLWVDKFATDEKMAGITTGTNDGTDYNSGGELWLMYGTNDNLYDKSGKSTGKESSAEFVTQFSKGSTMKILQGTNLYRLKRESNAATLFDDTGDLKAEVDNNRKLVESYYDTNYRIVDRGGNTVTRNGDGTFTFNNRTSAGEGVISPVSEHLAVQLTEYVENSVKAGTISITKNVKGITTNEKYTDYTFTLKLEDVFGGDENVSDYSTITATKDRKTNTGFITGTTEGTFTLQAGQTLSIAGIPYYTKYTITETTDALTQKPTTITNQVSGPTGLTQGSLTVTVTNTYPEYVSVKAKKTDEDDSSKGLSGAELELYYKEIGTPSTYSSNKANYVPNKLNAQKVSGNITIPDDAPVTGTITVQNPTYNYGIDTPPTSSDTEWILPRSDADYIYFRDYNIGEYAGEHDNQSFSNDTGKRSWLSTNFSTNAQWQSQEIDYTHNYWYAAQFTADGKKTQTYAMWERFVDKFKYKETYTNQDNSETEHNVDTVVWKIQPPDGYKYVRFMLYDGDTCIRTTEKIEYNLGKIYHKTSWGGRWASKNSKNCYFDVPYASEGYWAEDVQSTTGNINDKRSPEIDQPRKYEPTENKIIFHCNSEEVWHNIHIMFYKDNAGASPVNGQAFPGYMMEPYAYANNDYRLDDGYLTYELTIPATAKYFQINNGVNSGSEDYFYQTAVTQIQTDSTKNGGNYFILGSGSNYDSTNGKALPYECIDSGTNKPITDVPLYQCIDVFTAQCSDDANQTYTTSDVTSDYDYVYFECPTEWETPGKVYAYFYAGGNLRDDNWQRACYSAWPGVAASGTEYGDGTTNTYSTTYNYPVTSGQYNGTTQDGTLGPDATFTYKDGNTNYTVYKFRIPMGDRKNYSKVIFNTGLSGFGGGKETGVIEYNPGYIYRLNGSCIKHFEKDSTVPYEARTSIVSSEVVYDYIYVKTTGDDTTNWDDMHITLYDSNGTQIYQGGHGYIMEYAGKKTADGITYSYYKIPIPKDAAKFKLNNGMSKNGNYNKATSNFYYILRKTTNASAEKGNDYTKGNLVYSLSGTTLTRTEPKFTSGTPASSTTITGSQSSGVDFTNTTRSDKLYIYDNAPWNIGIGQGKVKFYDENGSLIGNKAYTLIKSEADTNSKNWYNVEIPDNAVSFTLTYSDGTKTTAAYDIYPYSSNGSGMTGSYTTGNMYYQTKSDGTLGFIESTVQDVHNTVNDETYEKRGDTLYIVTDTQDDDMTVTFYGSDGTAFLTNITAKFINKDENGDYWYGVSIPKNAVKFTVTNGSSNITDKKDIYELKENVSRYQKDYTLGDMQYRISSTPTLTLLYPQFTENDENTLEVSTGNTISSRNAANIDQSAVAGYADALAKTAATQNDADSMTTLPVLYKTDTNNITYTWEGSGSGGTNLKFVDANNWGNGNTDIYAYIWTNGSDGTQNQMDKTGTLDGYDVYELTLATDPLYVIFHQNSGWTGKKTGDISLADYNNGKGLTYTPSHAGTNSTYQVQNYIYFRQPWGGSWNSCYAKFINDSNNATNASNKLVSADDYYYQGSHTAVKGSSSNHEDQELWRFKIPDGTWTKVQFKSNDNSSPTYSTGEMDYNGKGSFYALDNNDVSSSTGQKVASYKGIIEKYDVETIPESFVMDTESTATYQPEDRYGMISNLNSRYCYPRNS